MISDIELKKLQRLSRLSFSGEEAKEFSTKLESVLSMINQIHEVECEDIEPLRSVCFMAQRLKTFPFWSQRLEKFISARPQLLPHVMASISITQKAGSRVWIK